MIATAIAGCGTNSSWAELAPSVEIIEAARPNSSARGEPSAAYWQQRADYRIDARLDEAGERVTLTSVMTYTNNSPDELGEVWVNLEQNLFRPGSLGAKRTSSGARYGHDDAAFVGGFEIERVLQDGRAVEIDVRDTVGRVALKTPLAARGGTTSIAFEVSFRIPERGSDRFGIDRTKDGTIFEIAQWFPSACVYDDVHGWNTLAYLGQGEFYTDFGTFEVSITVPAGHVVAATGELANAGEVLSASAAGRLESSRMSEVPVMIVSGREGEDGLSATGGSERTWRFRAENARTFAWASSAAYRWDACGADSGDGRRVLCQSVYPASAERRWGIAARGGGSTRMVKQSLEHYARMWGAYPFGTMTNAYGIAEGMEYPMIAFCRGNAGERDLWDVTSHEVSHQWFPMSVGSDERRHAWMDEGLTTFMNALATKERYGKDEGPTGEAAGARAFAEYNAVPLRLPVMTLADEIPESEYAVLAYDKPGTAMRVLREGVLGEEVFDRAMREYVRRWRFRQAQPADLFRTFEDVSGQELSWFWRGWFAGRDVMDQRIVGVFESPTGAEVDVEEAGGLKMPVILRAKFEDGRDVRVRAEAQTWSRKMVSGAWRMTVPIAGAAMVAGESGSRLMSVEIDPDGVMPDVEPRNNVWKR